MKKTSRVFCLILGALYLFSALCGQTALASREQPSSVPAPSTLAEWPSGPSLEAEAGILIDAKTGTVLFGKNADERLYPASITKLMTALLVLENASLSDVVTFSHDAVFSIEAGSSSIAVDEGEQLTVEQCMYALLIQSANDVANGLAEHVAGSMDAFAEMMNNRAAQLGCTNTHFVNAHGLHDENHYSSCHDMALIMKELIHNEAFIQFSSAHQYVIGPTNTKTESRYLNQSHKMLVSNSEYAYESTIAGKNGYTPEAGNTLVTYAARDDLELIAVSMKSNWKHYSDTIVMFDFGFDNFTSYNMANANIAALSKTDYLSASQSIFDTSAASFELSEDSWAVLPNSLNVAQLEPQLALNTASASNVMADITYSYQGVPLGYGSLLLVDNQKEHFDFNAHKPSEAESAADRQAGEPKSSFFSRFSLSSINPWIIGGAISGILVIILLIILFRKFQRRRPPKNPTLVRARKAKKDFRRRYRKRHKRFRRKSETMERR